MEDLPEINVVINQKEIEAKTRKLKVVWSFRESFSKEDEDKFYESLVNYKFNQSHDISQLTRYSIPLAKKIIGWDSVAIAPEIDEIPDWLKD